MRKEEYSSGSFWSKTRKETISEVLQEEDQLLIIVAPSSLAVQQLTWFVICIYLPDLKIYFSLLSSRSHMYSNIRNSRNRPVQVTDYHQLLGGKFCSFSRNWTGERTPSKNCSFTALRSPSSLLSEEYIWKYKISIAIMKLSHGFGPCRAHQIRRNWKTENVLRSSNLLREKGQYFCTKMKFHDFKLVILTNQGYISEVSAVSNDSQRNWRDIRRDRRLAGLIFNHFSSQTRGTSVKSSMSRSVHKEIYGYFLDEAEVSPSYLYMPGLNQKSHSRFRLNWIVESSLILHVLQQTGICEILTNSSWPDLTSA